KLAANTEAFVELDRIIPLRDGIDRADLQARGFLTVMTHDRGSDC
ncbi:hypothetical protein ECA0157_26058, partial [Escherichia coli ECA-0157]